MNERKINNNYYRKRKSLTTTKQLPILCAKKRLITCKILISFKLRTKRSKRARAACKYNMYTWWRHRGRSAGCRTSIFWI